jgi:hypothetical protein
VWLLSEIGNINLFSSKREFLAYCGCCPRIVSSAGKAYSAHISRHSNSYLRTIFYNAAVVVCNLVKKPSALKEYADRIMRKKGLFSKKLVYCIVAAKIVKIIHAIMRDGTSFNPYKDSIYQNPKNLNKGDNFTISNRKIIRRARNSLRRVNEIDNIGSLGEYAKDLAEQLEIILKKKV